MKGINFLNVLFLVVISITLTSCEVVGDIFKAGVWVGILLVVGILALLFFILRRL